MTKPKSPLSFYLGSGSKVKINALQNAINELSIHAAVVPIPGAQSGVNEQPVGRFEILSGALKRISSAYGIDPRGDAYFSMENGIELINGEWVDYAIVCLWVPSLDLSQQWTSDYVVFPTYAVELTGKKEGGFKDNTVGKTLQELGLVRQHSDPHRDLGGRSREDLLKDAVKELLDPNTSSRNWIEDLFGDQSH